MANQRPIGIFDSGAGGLTVAKEVMGLMPNENIIYFGDSLRAPYGSRSDQELIAFSREIITFLMSRDIKALVVACGTISTRIFDHIKEMMPQGFPIFEVASPGAKAAANASKSGNIGIIATQGTVESKTFERLILELNKDAKPTSKACPLFVPLVEEGEVGSKKADDIAKEYLSHFDDRDIDTLILGCTHYPFLVESIKKALGYGVVIVNPAEQLAYDVKDELKKKGMLSDTCNPSLEFFVSGDKEKFEMNLTSIIKGQNDIKILKTATVS